MSSKSKRRAKENKKKEKVTYIDDGSTVVDMNVPGMKWHDPNLGKNPRPKTSYRDSLKTFFAVQRRMIIPLIIVLTIMLIMYFGIRLLAGR